jgi:hypothetical protein
VLQRQQQLQLCASSCSHGPHASGLSPQQTSYHTSLKLAKTAARTAAVMNCKQKIMRMSLILVGWPEELLVMATFQAAVAATRYSFSCV